MRTASLSIAALAVLVGAPAGARQAALLASPGAYSLAPVQPVPVNPAPGGNASIGFGSRNTQTSSIELQSGLLGNTGTRAFVALGQARTDLPERSGSAPRISSRGGAIGIEKQFMDGATISVEGGWQRDRLPYALSSRADGVNAMPPGEP